nr:PREDICTED: receptor-interacting serine/threonine-protein kinase 2-like [Latimeria chalumnae]|eukprot:XP_014354305.1 PREDICTED: receptor-interacting serine/threonine-protein kinase 2-like [Latimeria chalumnae]
MAANIPFDIVPAEKIQDRRFLASGRFGSVYRASHQDWGIPIALKVFHIPTSTSSSQRDELLREAEIMNKARFLYILRLFGVYEEEESFGAVHLGIVMELMENGSLDQLLQHVVPVPWALKFRLIHEVALGMNYLHGLNPPLLHLDLKPNNVLLDEYFHVRKSPCYLYHIVFQKEIGRIPVFSRIIKMWKSGKMSPV